MAKKLFNTKIGLALGGGAAKGDRPCRGFKSTRRRIMLIYVTSLGPAWERLLAALYAFNVDVETIGGLAKRLTMSKVTSFKLSKTGFFSTESLRELIVEYVGEVNIEEANIPLSIVATDIKSGEEIILTHGLSA